MTAICFGWCCGVTVVGVGSGGCGIVDVIGGYCCFNLNVFCD